ncbi:MAG TPA: FixH family protein [Kiloniellaceae bacterium]|nr:FixH family protein [Kiloniellaceae bacterium]
MTGRKVLLLLLSFFGLMMAVNAAFVYFAVESFSGLETEHAYLKGLDYNTTLRAAAAQRALGWQVELSQEGALLDPHIALHYRDSAGQPLDGLSVTLELRRPTTEAFDATLVMAPEGPGRYGAVVHFPEEGAWILRSTASQEDGTPYFQEHRLWLK